MQKSKLKLIKLARELKVTIQHLREYLEAEGFEAPSSPNASITEEAYLRVLEAKAPELYQEHMESLKPKEEAPEENQADLRKAEVDSILHEGSSQGGAEEERFKSEHLETLKTLKVVEEAPAAPESAEAEEAAPEPVEQTPEAGETPVEPEVVEAPAASGADAPEADAPEAPAEAAEAAPEEKPADEEAPAAAAPEDGDGDGDKIALPVFKPGKVLGYHHEEEPKPARRKKDEQPEAPAGEPDPRMPVDSGETGKPGPKGRKRSAKRTKSEEERLKKMERGRAQGPEPRRRKGKKEKISKSEILQNIKDTTRAMEASGGKKRRHRRVTGVGEFNEDTNTLRVTEFISANELATLLDEPVADLIKKCFLMGTIITINQRLEREVIELLCAEYDQEVEFLTELEEEAVEDKEVEDLPTQTRHPVVTVMGHVDHGKTSVLDFIRKANVVSGESGGITQHIGAYEVVHKDQRITFLDTPGHHSFTAMRARGAKVTDVVVLVVAADDRVQEQTVEAIDHAKAAGVPIVVAVNKCDRPTADPQKIRKELAEKNILVEDWGGTYQCVDISAKTGHNMDKLLEEILVCSEILELNAVREGNARGAVIESQLDKGRGALATVLVERGTLKKGDVIVVGSSTGRVRMMVDENGNEKEEAGPSSPVQVIGLNEVPQAGDSLQVFDSDKEARQVAAKRRQIQAEQNQQRIARFSLAKLSSQIAAGEVAELPVIIKGDVNGSIEAIADELMKMQTEEVGITVVSRGVGTITENDVLLAKASGAVIIGFHVTPNQKARELAQREHVDVRLYKIIYEVVEEMKAGLEGMLRPEMVEEVIGTAEVRQLFRISRKVIAGCMMLSGKIDRSMKLRVIRENQVIHEGTVGSLKRFKDDVREVQQGYECGIQVNGYNDLREGDLIQGMSTREVVRRLELSDHEG